MKFPSTPFLKINIKKIEGNVRKMAEKADASNVIFRPHFKTHQSAQIGRIFEKYCVDRITVSSLDMALYFAESGWTDILVAVPVNLLEVEKVKKLSAHIKLGLLVDNTVSMKFLLNNLVHPVDVWIKIDCGYRRAGIPWNRKDDIEKLAGLMNHSLNTNFKGILTHAGNTYHARSIQEIQYLFSQSVDRMNTVRTHLHDCGYQNLKVSVGDTPGCKLASDFKGVDEIRPGNFVFFDAMMMLNGVCLEDDIAVQVGCPVTGVYPERGEAVVMGGAVHLSKEGVIKDGSQIYGLLPDGQGEVIALSQEHGVVRMPKQNLKKLRPGEMLFIYPVHSCLTANLHRKYYSDSGNIISKN